MKNIIIGIICLIAIVLIVFFIFLNKPNDEDSTTLPSEKTEDGTSYQEESNIEGEDNMNEIPKQITININGVTFTATLEDNQTARDFVSKLPLNIKMNELNGNEKYYYFEDSLSSDSTRIGRIEKGDIMLYGNDCLVLFYESFNTSYAYTRIGKLDNPDRLDDVIGSGSIDIYITS